MHKQPARFYMCPGCGLHGVMLSGNKPYALCFTKRGARLKLYEWWKQGIVEQDEVVRLVEVICASPLPEFQHSCQKSIRYQVDLPPSYGYKREQQAPPPAEMRAAEPPHPPSAPTPPKPPRPATIFIEGKTQSLN